MNTVNFGNSSYRALSALVVANLFPILGLLLWHWTVGDIIKYFWLENVAIGLINVFKLTLAKPESSHFEKLFLIPFFIVHFGGFSFGHAMAIQALFNIDLTPNLFLLAQLGVLFFSHFVSFIDNFVLKKEYLKVTTGQQMIQPYSRIIVVHLTIIFGGMLSMAFGTPLWAIAVLILIKTVIDLQTHLKEHSSVGTETQTTVALRNLFRPVIKK
jgi:hypothetical protein